jgi:hypothetical protein
MIGEIRQLFNVSNFLFAGLVLIPNIFLYAYSFKKRKLTKVQLWLRPLDF